MTNQKMSNQKDCRFDDSLNLFSSGITDTASKIVDLFLEQISVAALRANPLSSKSPEVSLGVALHLAENSLFLEEAHVLAKSDLRSIMTSHVVLIESFGALEVSLRSFLKIKLCNLGSQILKSKLRLVKVNEPWIWEHRSLIHLKVNEPGIWEHWSLIHFL